MIESLFSPYWYRVKDLRPALKTHAEIVCHTYRGEQWHVLHDSVSGRNHRFSASAQHFIGLMNGGRRVEDIWAICNANLGDDSPTQDEVISLLAKLHGADMLVCEVNPALDELLKRGEKRDQAIKSSRYKNPAAIRVPLLDLDAFLSKTLPYVRPLLCWQMLAFVTVLIILAGLQAASHWPILGEAISQQALQPYNLLLLLALYPIVKMLHELGHGYAVKMHGGEVHELGIMFLVLMPIPYVDASASAAFPERRKRIFVSAAGMIVELALSAVALLLWLTLEPSLLRDIALNIVLIGGVSTLLFNGNPLLRYDAYYILVDVIGIPNLAQRANRYLAYLIKRYCFGVEGAQSPVTARGEPAWFVFYSIASFVYRTVLMLTICIYLAGKMFVLGVVLAIWLVVSQFLLPISNIIGFLASDTLGRHRDRAHWVTATACVSAFALFTTLPLPSNTMHEGVVWLPGETRISADVDALVKRVLVQPGQKVVTGQSIVELDDPVLHAELALETAKVAELRARLADHRVNDLVQAQAVEEKLIEAMARQERASDRVKSLSVVSPTNGEVVIPNAQDLEGTLIKKGALLAYVMGDSNARVHLVVNQADQDRIQSRVDSVQVRLSSDPSAVMDATIAQHTPQAHDRLPSRVLSTAGGGQIAVDPTDQAGLRSLEKLFQYELELGLPLTQAQLGTRAYVRFEHGNETPSQQIIRRTRQLFLKHFDV